MEKIAKAIVNIVPIVWMIAALVYCVYLGTLCVEALKETFAHSVHRDTAKDKVEAYETRCNENEESR